MERRDSPIKRRGWDFGWDLGGFLEPLIEVRVYGDEIVVTSDLPGVDKEDIVVNATEDSLEINAKMRREYCFERWGTLQRRISFSSFKKVIELPSTVDIENVKSRFNRGVLEIRLPRKSRRRKIDVK
jgi:HSP20 family protein